MQWNGFQLQKLLAETAQQPDILYLLVVDTNGVIMVHNNPALIGKTYGQELDLKKISGRESASWRILSPPDQAKTFEVYRRLTSTGTTMHRRHGHMMMQMWLERGNQPRISFRPVEFIVFVGLDMSAVDEAVKSDTRHAVIMGVILLLIGFAGIVFLFLAQSYRATRTSLARIKAFSDNVVDHMPIGLVALDDNQKITALNYVAGSTLGLSLSEVIGQEAEHVLPAELADLLNTLTLETEVVDKEVDCRFPGGQKIPLEVSATRLHDDAQTFLGYVLLFKDLSEVRALRKEIARSQRLASVGRLASGVSHEIRNPLSSIKGFATYFKERYQNNPEDLHIAKLMIQEVDRLNRVVGQLHEFARPITITPKPVPIQKFIADTLKLVERQAAEAAINIQTRFDLPIDKIDIDPDRMNQVLLNLYLNAMEAMPDGGELRVALAAASDQSSLELKVSDTGTGIGQEDLANIFDPYFTTKTSGTGLGLAIVHNIIEAHNGQIKVESQTDQGTTVTIFLPIKLPEQQ